MGVHFCYVWWGEESLYRCLGGYSLLSREFLKRWSRGFCFESACVWVISDKSPELKVYIRIYANKRQSPH